jgi:beta-glucan synthesis-associated protein KRE6
VPLCDGFGACGRRGADFGVTGSRQQAVTALTTVPERAYAGTGAEFVSYGTSARLAFGMFTHPPPPPGFEYFGDPKDASAGYVTWQVDGTPSYAITPKAVPADAATEILQRLISVEPMVRVCVSARVMFR